MGFFSELKNDLSGVSEESTKETTQGGFNLGQDASVAEQTAEATAPEPVAEEAAKPTYSFVDTINQLTADVPLPDVDAPVAEMEEAAPQEASFVVEQLQETPLPEEGPAYDEPLIPAQTQTQTVTNDYYMNNGGMNMDIETGVATDETAVVTEGMTINGDLQTTGNLDMIGRINGNVTCYGKLNVTGEITGDSTAAELYAEAARITGEVHSSGSVKIGQSTVIIGNVHATSAVIAGAVKGDIDVHGPVVLDTTAIVMGNIKSQSVQINNGAVIEGMCSQTYAEVNPQAFFDGLK